MTSPIPLRTPDPTLALAAAFVRHIRVTDTAHDVREAIDAWSDLLDACWAAGMSAGQELPSRWAANYLRATLFPGVKL